MAKSQEKIIRIGEDLAKRLRGFGADLKDLREEKAKADAAENTEVSAALGRAIDHVEEALEDWHDEFVKRRTA